MAVVNDFDIGAHLEGALACQHTQATAAGTGDNAYITGAIIDLNALDGRPVSALLIAPFEAALQEDETLTVKSKVEHGDDSALGDAEAYSYDGAESDGVVVATGGTGGSTELGVYTRAINLVGAKRYIRVSVHQDLSATGTDTNELMAALAFLSPSAPVSQSE
jgi:hypothetical protein